MRHLDSNADVNEVSAWLQDLFSGLVNGKITRRHYRALRRSALRRWALAFEVQQLGHKARFSRAV